MGLPYILLLDMDGTIIGDTAFCSHEYAIIELIFKNCILKKDNVCMKREQIDFQDELKNGLLRPNAKDFIHYCKKRFEIFFYTNASHEWATNTMVPQIEKALDFKVNRPIFTREKSISWTKTIINIAPLIQKSLVKKYPLLEKEGNLEKVFNERLVFIDDIKNNLQDYKKRQIVCPEYKFTPYYNIQYKILTKYKLPESVFNNKEIHTYMENNGLPLYNKHGSMYQKNKECILLHSMYKTKQYEVYNDSLKKDTFFNDMITTFEKIKTFTDKEIAKINKSL